MASSSSSISIPSNKSYDAVSIDPEEPRNEASSQRDDIDQLIHQGWKICRLLAGSGVAASSGEFFTYFFHFFKILILLLFKIVFFISHEHTDKQYSLQSCTFNH